MGAGTLRDDDGPTVAQFEQVVFSAMLAGSTLPLIVLAIAGAAFSNEIEDRTIANLTLAPIPRWQIVVPKLLATITLAAPFIWRCLRRGAHSVPVDVGSPIAEDGYSLKGQGVGRGD